MFEQLLSVKELREELSQVNAYIDEFLQPNMETGVVADVLSSARETRGKMIRPILLLLSARFGPDYGAKRDRLCKLGAITEIVHMTSLIHDDIVDDSPLRRGKITIQSQFGKDMAVYAGDFMFSRVMYYLAKENLLKACEIIGRTVEEMCRGELGQMACRWDTETTIDAYFKNIYGKTVALFATSAKLGAIESGCAEHAIGYLGGVGENLGYMFQMRDDLLDYVSEESREGKPTLKDFSDGIYTMPVLYALSSMSCGERLREIAKRSADTSDYDQRLTEIKELVCSSGGIQFTTEQIKNHAIQANRQLKALPRRDATAPISQLISGLSDIGELYSWPVRQTPL